MQQEINKPLKTERSALSDADKQIKSKPATTAQTKPEAVRKEKESEEEVEESSAEESCSSDDSDSAEGESDEYSDDEQGRKKKKIDEEDEKIIDNQFPEINVFEKNNSFLGSIISSWDDDEDYDAADGSSSEASASEESNDEELGSEDDSPIKVNKERRKEKLYLNIAHTQYPVVKEVGKLFNFKITRNDDADWDLIWLDGQLPPERMLRMKSHQKANHYPGMYALSRKNHLGRNLMKMMKLFPSDYRFFPRTWLLPYEMVDFKNNFNRRGKSHKAFIVKPEASSQGEGIFLTKTLKQIDPDDHCVAQEYIHKPYLIDDLKFDLRIYVMVYGVEPLRIYLYKEGIARFATSTYWAPTRKNMKDLFMHLTNYAINKNSDDFIFNEEESCDDVGHKRSLSAVLKQLEDEGNDPNQIMNKISDLIIKTIVTCQPSIAHAYKTLQPDDLENSMIFEILGFDVLLDYKCRPWLLEVNSSPSFTTDTPLDRKIK